jgi:hypothetical protein
MIKAGFDVEKLQSWTPKLGPGAEFFLQVTQEHPAYQLSLLLAKAQSPIRSVKHSSGAIGQEPQIPSYLVVKTRMAHTLTKSGFSGLTTESLPPLILPGVGLVGN